MSVPRHSLRGRSGARYPLRCAPQLRRARSGRESWLVDRTGSRHCAAAAWTNECRSRSTTFVTREPSVTEPPGGEMVGLVVDKMTLHGKHPGEAMPGSLGSIPE